MSGRVVSWTNWDSQNNTGHFAMFQASGKWQAISPEQTPDVDATVCQKGNFQTGLTFLYSEKCLEIVGIRYLTNIANDQKKGFTLKNKNKDSKHPHHKHN